MKYVLALLASVSLSAMALTFESGDVIVTNADGSQDVVRASETEVGQAALASDGVYVSGRMVFINLNGNVIEVPVHKIAGKSREDVAKVLGEAVVAQIEDLQQATVEEAARLVDSGEVDNAVSAVGKSVEQIISEIDVEAATGAIVGATDAQIDAINDYFESIDGERPVERAPQSCDPEC